MPQEFLFLTISLPHFQTWGWQASTPEMEEKGRSPAADHRSKFSARCTYVDGAFFFFFNKVEPIKKMEKKTLNKASWKRTPNTCWNCAGLKKHQPPYRATDTKSEKV